MCEDYQADKAPELCDDDDPVLRWQRLVLPIRTGDREVEKVRDIDFGGQGRRSQRLDVYRTRARPDGRPVFRYIPGGGWVIGDKREQGIPLMLQLASRGWGCVTATCARGPKAPF